MTGPTPSETPDETAAATAVMDQAMALIRDAAQGILDAAEGGPVVDTWMFGLGCDLIRESVHDEDELVILLAAATMLLAQTMGAQR